MVAASLGASKSAITSERKGYGRGLILGLTMAETFLLLVFSLLLVAAAALAEQRKIANDALAERDVAIAKLAAKRPDVVETQRELRKLQEQNTLLAESNKRLEQTIAAVPAEVLERATIDDDWQELTLANDLAEAVKSEGLTPSEAIRLAPALKVLKEKGFLDIEAPRDRLAEALAAAAEARQQPHTWPPIINLSEAGGYYFAVGSAALTDAFRRRLRDEIVERIAGFLDLYKVDVVEVIGHTDEQNLAEGRTSNLDRTVGSILQGQATASDISPADNAGLGLARAIAVAEILRHDPRLADATVLPLSGAQLIMPGDVVTDGQHGGDVRERRRIEIRIRRRADQIVGTE